MKAYEFSVKATSEGEIEFPEGFLKLLSENQEVRVIVLIEELMDKNEQLHWDNITAKQFLDGYSESDAIYDEVK